MTKTIKELKAALVAAWDAYEDEYRKIYHHPPVQLTGVIEATTVVTPVSVVDTSKEAV